MATPRHAGWARFLPGVAVLRTYRRGWLRADVLAGLTVTAGHPGAGTVALATWCPR